MDYETFESEAEDFLEYDEAGEFDEFEFGEFDERKRFRRRTPLRTAARGNPTVKKPPAGFATKSELDATAKRLDGRIATNANAIKALDGRMRAAESELGKVGGALRKEMAIRKKQTTEVQKGLNESRQIAMMMPIISSLAGDDKDLAMMLPMLMYSGAMGGSGSSSGDNSMMMPLMMISLIGRD